MDRYEEALERAKQGLPIDEVFPELKESKDERIRKHIIEILERLSPCHWDGNEKSECIAYLEKMKDIDCLACDQHLKGYIAGRKVTEEEKQKPIDLSELMVHKEPYIAPVPIPIVADEQKPVDEKTTDEIGKSVRKKWAFDFISFLNENRCDGKMCVSNGECMDIKNAFISADWEKLIRYYNKYTQQPAEWSEEDATFIEEIDETLFMAETGRNEVVKTQIERERNWLKFLTERFNLQPKHEWSEEDKKNLQGVIDEIEANKNTAPSYDILTYDRFLSWLKSLRPQPHWKPSEKQMEALNKVIHEVSMSLQLKDKLIHLEDELKKLM